jgi:hypothetical protein
VATTYIIEGKDTALDKHVGNEVEITGRLDPGATAPSKPTNTDDPSKILRGPGTGWPLIYVDSIKTISTGCPK